MTNDEATRADAEWLDPVVRALREPVDRRAGSVEAVVRAAMETDGDPAGSRPGLLDWLLHPRLSLSPLSAAGWATAVAVAVALLLQVPGATAPTPEARVVRHQFVLFAPEAGTVSVVGDFNGWDPGATPLVRRGEVWTALVSLEPGRHVYSFIIDGEEWVADADAPRAPEDEFGRPSSVLLLTKDT